MPRFFFNIQDGKNILDKEGEVFADWHEARRHAIKFAGRVLDNEADQLALGEDWCMEVCDQTGLVLFRLEFSVSLSAAIGDRPHGLPAISN